MGRRKRKGDDGDDVERSPKRITLTRAKREFKLTDAELAALSPPLICENPHYSSAAPMRLYLFKEVQACADKKKKAAAKEQRYLEEHAEEIAQQKAAEKAEAARAAREAARERLERMEGGKARRIDAVGRGGGGVAQGALPLVLERLVSALEPEGVWGPSLVVKDLANAALVCWEWCAAVKEVMPSVTVALQAIPSVKIRPASKLYTGGGPGTGSGRGARGPTPVVAWAAVPGAVGWGVWDAVVSAPAGLKLDQLKAAARVVGSRVTGTKPQITVGLLEALTLPVPTPAPAAALRALRLEAACWGRDGGLCTELYALMEGLQQCTESAVTRALLSVVPAARRAALPDAKDNWLLPFHPAAAGKVLRETRADLATEAGIWSMGELRALHDEARSYGDFRPAPRRRLAFLDDSFLLID